MKQKQHQQSDETIHEKVSVSYSYMFILISEVLFTMFVLNIMIFNDFCLGTAFTKESVHMRP